MINWLTCLERQAFDWKRWYYNKLQLSNFALLSFPIIIVSHHTHTRTHTHTHTFIYQLSFFLAWPGMEPWTVGRDFLRSQRVAHSTSPADHSATGQLKTVVSRGLVSVVALGPTHTITSWDNFFKLSSSWVVTRASTMRYTLASRKITAIRSRVQIPARPKKWTLI